MVELAPRSDHLRQQRAAQIGFVIADFGNELFGIAFDLPQIILRGGEWYASVGTERSKGTKVFALTIVACTLAWTVAEVWIFARTKVLYVDPQQERPPL